MPTIEDLQEELKEEREAARIAVRLSAENERYKILNLIREAKDVPDAINMIERLIDGK